MSAATDDEVVLTVLVFPKSIGAFVTTVRSPPSVIPSKQICVVEAVVHVELDMGCAVLCHTPKVPVSEVLCAATYALKSPTAVLDWFDPHVPAEG
jgi:hypothetical protein